jgi:hypothetical protein
MKGKGTKHIILLYVNVPKGTWVTVSTSSSPVPFAFFYLDLICKEWRQEL